MGRALSIPLTRVRDLTVEDLEPSADSSATPIRKLRDSHHQVARLIAHGLKIRDASVMTGYTEGRVQMLLNDPAFCDLCEYYRGRFQERVDAVLDRMRDIGLDALSELQDRLDLTPEEFSNDALMKLVTISLDRAGFSPVKKMQIQQLMLTPSDLKELKDRAREHAIEGEAFDANRGQDRLRAAHGGPDFGGPGPEDEGQGPEGAG